MFNTLSVISPPKTIHNSRSNPSRSPFACVTQRVQNEGHNLLICTVFGTCLANSRVSLPQFIFCFLLSILLLRPCTTTAKSPTLAGLLRFFTTTRNHLKTSVFLDSLPPTLFALPSSFQSASLVPFVPMVSHSTITDSPAASPFFAPLLATQSPLSILSSSSPNREREGR